MLWVLDANVSSVQFSRSVVSDTLRPHGLQHTRPPCPSPTPRVYSDSCASSWWCHATISSSVIFFSSCLQPSPASGSFLISQFFTSGGQNIRVSASAPILPMNIQDWLPFRLTGLISLSSKGLKSLLQHLELTYRQRSSPEMKFIVSGELFWPQFIPLCRPEYTETVCTRGQERA